MTEIRLAWSIQDRKDLTGRPVDGGLWHPDTPANREAITITMEAGNEAYGDGTHWIEEREA